MGHMRYVTVEKNNTRGAAHFPHNCRFKFVEENKTLITLRRYRTAVLGYRVYSSDPVELVLQYPFFPISGTSDDE